MQPVYGGGRGFGGVSPLEGAQDWGGYPENPEILEILIQTIGIPEYCELREMTGNDWEIKFSDPTRDGKQDRLGRNGTQWDGKTIFIPFVSPGEWYNSASQ